VIYVRDPGPHENRRAQQRTEMVSHRRFSREPGTGTSGIANSANRRGGISGRVGS
jgi:hypothetical protein